MKTLTLDMNKWRCGDTSEDPSVRLGTGSTKLLNEDGFMCCLGQFSTQLDPSIEPLKLLDWTTPEGLNVDIPLLTKLNDNPLKGECQFSDTDFSEQAMRINDDYATSIEEKIKSLRRLLNENYYKLEVIALQDRQVQVG